MAVAKEAIERLAQKEIIKGVTDTTFAPGNPIRRGDFCLLIARTFDLEMTKPASFRDVASQDYYSGAIGALEQMGVVNGMGDGFYPANSISRQDLFTIAYRMMEKRNFISAQGTPASFTDAGEISAYAVKPIEALSRMGLVAGDNSGRVNPQATATRAEIAVFMNRLSKLL